MGLLNLLPKPFQRPVGQFLSKSIVLKNSLKWMIKPPTRGRYVEVSMLVPAEFDEGSIDTANFDIILRWVKKAQNNDLACLSSRVHGKQLSQINRFPGEHYRLLNAIINESSPALVVEVGTYTGLASLVISKAMSAGKLVTYDIIPWNKFSETVLRDSDFPKIEQRLGDLADETYFTSQKDIILNADILFIDAPKNGIFEQRFIKLFMKHRKTPCVLIFDDIRLLNMIELWRSLNFQKIDLTSFGHWTGTGIVFYSP